MMFPAIQDNIKIAKNTLLNGEPIIYPTDTLYSFGALATDSKTIRLINDIKRRTSPLSIVVSKVKEINTYAHIKKKCTKWYAMPRFGLKLDHNTRI